MIGIQYAFLFFLISRRTFFAHHQNIIILDRLSDVVIDVDFAACVIVGVGTTITNMVGIVVPSTLRFGLVEE
jgi:hypothetical protein